MSMPDNEVVFDQPFKPLKCVKVRPAYFVATLRNKQEKRKQSYEKIDKTWLQLYNKFHYTYII